MLTASLAIRNIGTNVCTKTLSQISKGNLHASIERNSLVFRKSLESNCLPTLPICPVFYYRSGRASGQLMWQTSKQFHLQIHASSDEDYRSSRNIAVNLFRRYRNVINRGGSDNLKEFIDVGVNAYALGCTDESLRTELLDMKNSGIEVEGLQSYGGGTSVTYKIVSEEVQECILWLSIVFITIMCTPQPTIVRWSSTSPVSIEIMHQWKGFCALIANAYYKRGMAWHVMGICGLQGPIREKEKRDRERSELRDLVKLPSHNIMKTAQFSSLWRFQLWLSFFLGYP